MALNIPLKIPPREDGDISNQSNITVPKFDIPFSPTGTTPGTPISLTIPTFETKTTTPTKLIIPERPKIDITQFENQINPAKAISNVYDKLTNIPIVREGLDKLSKITTYSGIRAAIDATSPDVIFKDAYEARIKQQEGDNSFTDKFLTQLKESAPQTALGVGLTLLYPPLGATYWGALSTAGERERKGTVNFVNVGTDVFLDGMLGSSIESLLKAPAKTLFDTIKKTFITEGGTEVAQDLIKYGNDYRSANTPKEKQIVIDEVKDYFKSGQILITAGVGGLTGAGIGAGFHIGQEGIQMYSKMTPGERQRGSINIPNISSENDDKAKEFVKKLVTDDEFSTSNNFENIANTNQYPKVYDEILNQTSGIPNESRILWSIANNPNATNDTRLSALSRYEKMNLASDEAINSVRNSIKPQIKSEVDILPSDIPVYKEAKAVGAKRIAPDRIPHQQLTPEAGIEALVKDQERIATKNANSWTSALAKLEDLKSKYGDIFPSRTEVNIKKYPDLVKDFSLYQQYKKYAPGYSNLSGIIETFKKNADRVSWNQQKEDAYRAKVKDIYIKNIKEDISRGYLYPQAVLKYDKSFEKALTSRERYNKGLRTSFSSDDARIVFEDTDKIGAGMKRQDGKPITEKQKKEIKDGVIDFANILGLDMKKLAENNRWVYVHLSGKNPFLTKNAAGLYRRGKDNISISVGGVETFETIENGKKVKKVVNTTMAHELGHALDYQVDNKLFDNRTLFELASSYNPIEFSFRSRKYWSSYKEVTARMIEEYVSMKKGHDSITNRQGYWKKEIFDTKIVPAIDKAIQDKFAEYIRTDKTPLTLGEKEKNVHDLLGKTVKYNDKIYEVTGTNPLNGKNEVRLIQANLSMNEKAKILLSETIVVPMENVEEISKIPTSTQVGEKIESTVPEVKPQPELKMTRNQKIAENKRIKHEMSVLEEEARKYKTSEEFIDSNIMKIASERDTDVLSRHNLTLESSKKDFNTAIKNEQERLINIYGTNLPPEGGIKEVKDGDLQHLESIRNKIFDTGYIPKTKAELTKIWKKATTQKRPGIFEDITLPEDFKQRIIDLKQKKEMIKESPLASKNNRFMVDREGRIRELGDVDTAKLTKLIEDRMSEVGIENPTEFSRQIEQYINFKKDVLKAERELKIAIRDHLATEKLSNIVAEHTDRLRMFAEKYPELSLMLVDMTSEMEEGAKKGYKLGERIGEARGIKETKIAITNQLRNTLDIKIAELKREGDLKLFKEKIISRDFDRVKEEIIDYLKINIPVSERGGFLNLIKNARKQKDLISAFIRIDKKVDSILRKESLKKLISTINRMSDSNSISVDYKNKIKEVLENYELKGHTQSFIDKLKETQDYIDRQVSIGEDVELPRRIVNKLKILDKIGKDELSLSEIETLQKEVELLAKLGETKWTTKQELYDAEKQTRKEELLKSVSSIESKKVKNIGIEKDPRKYVETYTKALNYLQRTKIGLTPIEGLADITGMQPMKKVLDADFSNYLTFNDSVIKEWYEITKNFDENNFRRIGVYAMSKQDGGIQRLENNGITEEMVKDLALTDQEMKAYKFARESFDRNFPAVKKYALDNYNKDVGQVKNYVSFMSDNDAMNELELYDRFGTSPEIKTSTKTVEQGFTKERSKQAATKLELNIDKIFRRHLDDVAYMLTIGKDVKQYFEIVNSPEMREKLGDVGATAWLQYLDLMARKGGSEGAKRIAALDIIRRNLAAGVLSFRLSSALVQLTSFTDTMGTIGAEWSMKGAYSIATSKEWRNFVIDNFPEVKKAVGDDVAFREFGDTFLQKATQVGLTPLQALDGLMRSSAIAGAYQMIAKEKGIEVDLKNPNREVINEATKYMRQSQGSSFFKDQPLSITTNYGLTDNKSLNKTLLTFQSFMLNRWDNMNRQIWRMGIKEKEYKKAFMSFLWMVLVASAMEETIRRGIKLAISGIFGSDDKEKDSFINNSIMNIIQSVPIMGQLVSAMQYSSNPIPTINTFEQTISGANSIWNGKELNTKIKGGISVAGATGSLLGVPGSGQISQLLKEAIPSKNKSSGSSINIPSVKIPNIKIPSIKIPNIKI